MAGYGGAPLPGMALRVVLAVVLGAVLIVMLVLMAVAAVDGNEEHVCWQRRRAPRRPLALTRPG